jgi:hypothetical protein
MRKRIVAIIAVVALMGLLLPASVFAADTGAVTCTVSAVMVSVSVSPGSVAYGTLNVGTTENTLVGELNDTQTATNDGSGTENFNIKSSDASGTTAWTLVDTGAPGANEFKHEFSTDSGTNWTAMPADHTYTSLATGITATTGTQTFDLQITMPASTTDYGAHTITVTVQAVQGS